MNFTDTAYSKRHHVLVQHFSWEPAPKKTKCKLNMIHFVLVAEVDIAKKYEQADIVQPIIRDWRRLNEGILLKNGKVVYAFFSCTQGR